MEYRVIPKTGDRLSILGFGCMRFPTKDGNIDECHAEEQIIKAIESGINYFDTAYPYHNGTSESFLGKIMAKGYRDRINIATKLPQWLVHKKTDFDVFFSEQLKRLQSSWIDFYLVHSIDGPAWDRLVKLGIKEWLSSIKEKGTVRNIGFSYHGNKKDFNRIIDDFDWDICQIQYNILDVEAQAGIDGLKYASKKGIGIMIMEPLKGGTLTRQIPKDVKDVWRESGKEWSSAEWALRWLWDHNEITTVLSGMTEDVNLEENICIAENTGDYTLSKDDHDRVSKVKKIYDEQLKIACTGCGYCIPCPFHVEIPRVFELYNGHVMFKGVDFYKEQYRTHLSGVMGGNAGYASLCKDCGACEKHCPQGLSIRNLLKESADAMEDRTFKMIVRLRSPIRMFLRVFGIFKGILNRSNRSL